MPASQPFRALGNCRNRGQSSHRSAASRRRPPGKAHQREKSFNRHSRGGSGTRPRSGGASHMHPRQARPPPPASPGWPAPATNIVGSRPDAALSRIQGFRGVCILSRPWPMMHRSVHQPSVQLRLGRTLQDRNRRPELVSGVRGCGLPHGLLVPLSKPCLDSSLQASPCWANTTHQHGGTDPLPPGQIGRSADSAHRPVQRLGSVERDYEGSVVRAFDPDGWRPFLGTIACAPAAGARCFSAPCSMRAAACAPATPELSCRNGRKSLVAACAPATLD